MAAKTTSQIIPIGKPLRLEKAMLNQVLVGKMILGIETMIALNPRIAMETPKVAMKEGIFNLATKKPLRHPINKPMTIIMGMTKNKGMPS